MAVALASSLSRVLPWLPLLRASVRAAVSEPSPLQSVAWLAGLPLDCLRLHGLLSGRVPTPWHSETRSSLKILPLQEVRTESEPEDAALEG